MTEDERYMNLALQSAAAGLGQTSPNPLVGAVIVKDGFVVGMGAHLRAGTPHAEVHALRQAGEAARGATAYVTLEPCAHFGRTPPCADALIGAGVTRVVIACEDPNPQVAGEGINRLRAAGIEVEVGVRRNAATRLNEAFFHWIRTGLPYVVWKSAVTADGFTACSNGHSQYITSPQAREAVQALRLTIPAIAVGVGTVLADDPALTARPDGLTVPAERQPLRIVFDTHLRTPASARLLKQPGRTRIYVGDGVPASRMTDVVAAADNDAVEIVPVAVGPDGRLSLRAALQHLAGSSIHSLLVEGGATLIGALLRQRLIERLVQFTAPKLLGGGLPTAVNGGAESMADAVELVDPNWSAVGTDIRLDAVLRYPAAVQVIDERGEPDVHRTD